MLESCSLRQDLKMFGNYILSVAVKGNALHESRFRNSPLVLGCHWPGLPPQTQSPAQLQKIQKTKENG